MKKLFLCGCVGILSVASVMAATDARTTVWTGKVKMDDGREDGKVGATSDQGKSFAIKSVDAKTHTVAVDFWGASKETWTFDDAKKMYTWDDGEVKISATETTPASVKTPGFNVPADATNVKVYGTPKCEKSASYKGKDDVCATVHPSLTWTFYTTAKGESVYRMDRLNKKDATKGRNLVITQ